MSLFHRTGGYSVFIAEIDAEHKTLFQLVDELAAALDSQARGARSKVLESLAAQMQVHFAHEERLMRASGYDALEWHKGQHDGARRQAKRLIKRIEEGDRKAPGELLDYLTGWLQSHVLVTDRMMAAYLRNFYRRRAA
ncbi:MAG: bacteriohemerythrin [Bryobacteraceae bacterium]